MKHLWLLIAPAGLMLSSATPPARSWPRLEPLPVLNAAMPCPDGKPCIELAGGPAEPPPEEAQRAPPATPAPAEPPAPESASTEASPSAPPVEKIERSGLKVLVSLPQQKVYVFEGSELVATSPVSTGKRGHETPAGRFRILQKKVHHRSSKYDNAPMPYMQRLTNYGIALHAGRLPGYPASHGCIRLPRSFAKKLYDLTSHGTQVTVTRAKPKSAAEALNLA
jgi:lipoprotein-anchoring transpeptidase ErfK/SrfK